MKYNTRFNPTVSGPLSVGSLYMALVNYTEAINSGGQCILRIDDAQEFWLRQLGRPIIQQIGDDYIRELSLFMPVDKIEWQTSMPEIESLVPMDNLLKLMPKPLYVYGRVVEYVPNPGIIMYPYTALFTLEKAVWDWWDGISWLIRGEDLVTEFALYEFFTDILGLPPVRHTYLPRLRRDARKELSSISKTFSSYKLCDQVERFGVDDTLEFLKQSCLIDPTGTFEIKNIKCDPIVTGFIA
jgi:hypothetical protein